MARDSFLRRPLRAKERSRRVRPNSAFLANLAFEVLEDRSLLSIGAELAADLNTTAAGSDPRDFVNVGGMLYFTADDGVHGRELWRSDGTCGGTTIVADVYPGAGYRGQLPSGITNVGGQLFFTTYHPHSGQELWVTDGTSSGTRLVRDLVPGPDGAHPQHLINVAGTLYFAAKTDAYGGELWKSDGTCSGTVLVRDIRSGWRGSSPEQLAVVGDRLYFVATDREHGTELWTSDGTLEGTILVSDMNPGPFGSDPEDLTVVGDRVYFTANEPARGREIWRTAAVAGALSANGLAGAASELPVSSLPRAPTASDSPRETRSIVTPVADAPAGNVIDQLLGGGDFDWLLLRPWQDLFIDEPSWGGDDGEPDTRLR